MRSIQRLTRGATSVPAGIGSPFSAAGLSDEATGQNSRSQPSAGPPMKRPSGLA